MTLAQRRLIERRMGWMTLLAAAVAVLYWATYFAAPSVLGIEDAVTRAFESAFPVADGALAALLLAAGWCLLTGKGAGAPLLVAGGAVAVYLGLLDFTFYAGRGLYRSVSAAAAIELAINALCLAGGLIALRLGWRLWRPA